MAFITFKNLVALVISTFVIIYVSKVETVPVPSNSISLGINGNLLNVSLVLELQNLCKILNLGGLTDAIATAVPHPPSTLPTQAPGNGSTLPTLPPLPMPLPTLSNILTKLRCENLPLLPHL